MYANKLLDPRFDLVSRGRGSATTWVALNRKCAVPGVNYGRSILNIYERTIKAIMQNLEKVLKDIKY